MSDDHDALDPSLSDVPEELLDWIAAGRPEPRPTEVIRWRERQHDPDGQTRQLERLWHLTAPAESQGDLADLGARMGGRVPRLYPTGGRFVRAAAMVLLLLAGGLAVAQLSREPDRGARSRIEVPAGSTTTLHLPGDIAVLLNGGSTLSFAAGEVSEVTLEGDGHFRVPHDPSRTFVVHTASGVIRDLGTVFGVSARDGDVSVVVTDGRVALEAQGRSVQVTAGHAASAALGQAPTDPVPADLDVALAWTEGRSVFIDRPLTRIAQDLTLRYGVPVTVAAPLRTVRVTASVGASTDVEGALRLVTLAAGAHYERSSDGWLITTR